MISTVIPVASGQTVYDEYNGTSSDYEIGDIVTYQGS